MMDWEDGWMGFASGRGTASYGDSTRQCTGGIDAGLSRIRPCSVTFVADGPPGAQTVRSRFRSRAVTKVTRRRHLTPCTQ